MSIIIKEDLLFGKIAVLNNIITQGQLDEAIGIQNSRSYFAPIAAILLQKGYLTRQQMHTILETQKRRLPRPAIAPQEKRDDLIFAYLAEKLNLTNLAAIHDGITMQNQMVKRGLLFRISEILINLGYLTVEQAEQIAIEQERLIISCPDCDTKYNTIGLQCDKFVCKKCGMEMLIPEDILQMYSPYEIEVFRKNLDEIAKQESLNVLYAELEPLRAKRQKVIIIPEDGDSLYVSYGAYETSDEDSIEELIGEPVDELDFITAGVATIDKLKQHKYTDEWYWNRDIVSDISGETSSADISSEEIEDEETIDLDYRVWQKRHIFQNTMTIAQSSDSNL